MTEPRDYDDIPGTYAFDKDRCREGYELNRFCTSLLKAENRAAFLADQAGYLDNYGLTPEQRQAVLQQDWLRMIQLGGNIYYVAKLGATHKLTFEAIASKMAGMSAEKYRQTMVNGGRSIDGKRSKSEWDPQRNG